MNVKLISGLKSKIRADVLTDEGTLHEYSHDASLFEVKPQAVVFPKDVKDIKEVVRFVSENKKKYPSLSITGRSAGTDMSGGAINDGIIMAFSKHFNKTPQVNAEEKTAFSQPGVFYRDFEAQTLKHGLFFPSYPASREICAIGGIVNNNSGGEKSLIYGKTEKYVQGLKVVLSDGNEYELKALNEGELKKKMSQKDFEGEIYRRIQSLILNHSSLIAKAKPQVSKNSSGYALWNVYDREAGVFDLTKLFVGAQGTLGLVTEAKLSLVPVKNQTEMIIVFMESLEDLGKIINEVLECEPETFESYDDHTLRLALRYFNDFAKQLGTKNLLRTAFSFLPEFMMVLTRGLPKLVLQIEFEGDQKQTLDEKIRKLHQTLGKYKHVKVKTAPSEKAERKYWLIRRESFNLLRNKIKDKHTAPFIDDIVVPVEALPEFLPRLYGIFDDYRSLIYTIAGHVGNGNFHIIPLMNLERQEQREIIPRLAERVYDLVLEYHGSITGEHNDGLIRTPYLEKMYGKEMVKLFEEVKNIFDPQNIFNPRKKVHADMEFALSHIRTQW